MQQSRPGKSRLIVSFKVIRLSCDGDDLISGCFRFLFLLYPHVWSANIFNASYLLDSLYLRTTQDLEETEWLKLTEKPLCLMVQYIIMHSFVDLIIATYVSVPIEPASLSEKKNACVYQVVQREKSPEKSSTRTGTPLEVKTVRHNLPLKTVKSPLYSFSVSLKKLGATVCSKSVYFTIVYPLVPILSVTTSKQTNLHMCA